MIKLGNKLLHVLNHGPPVITQSQKTYSKDPKGVAYNTVTKFTNMVLNCYRYIVNNNKDLDQEIKRRLSMLWKTDLRKYLTALIEPWSPWNTQCIMRYTGINNKQKETLNNIFRHRYGNKVFSTRNDAEIVKQKWLPPLDKFISMSLRFSKEKFQRTVKSMNILVYCFSIFFALAMNLDGFINSNNFSPPKVLNNDSETYLHATMGSDKADVDGMGCYVFSVAMNGPSSSSATASTACLLIYGGWVDDYRSMMEIYHKSGYNKQMEAIQRLPSMVSIVKYRKETSININNIDNNSDIDISIEEKSNDSERIISRLSRSALLAYESSGHISLNNERKPIETDLIDEWKDNHPSKSIDSDDTMDTDTEAFSRWDYENNKKISLGMNVCTPTRKVSVIKHVYNWQTGLKEINTFLESYTPDSSLLIAQGYYKDDHKGSQTAKAITAMCKRSITNKKPETELNFVEDFQFTNRKYFYLYNFLLCMINCFLSCV